jgi:hypothetical protein
MLANDISTGLGVIHRCAGPLLVPMMTAASPAVRPLAAGPADRIASRAAAIANCMIRAEPGRSANWAGL